MTFSIGKKAEATEGPGKQVLHLCQEHTRQIRITAALPANLTSRLAVIEKTVLLWFCLVILSQLKGAPPRRQHQPALA